jgi:hypothetical protein
MIGQKLSFKFLLSVFVLMPFASIAQVPSYEVWNTGSDSLIYKEVATHRIVDEDLISLIVEYDRMYSQFERDSLRGITVYCEISDRTITYSVNYTVGIGGKSPILLCEPIGGREVHVVFLDNLSKQIQLPYQRSVELLKNAHPKEYEHHVAEQKITEEGSIHVMSVTNDFVSWEIVFDKYTGECLSKDTPNETRHYKNYQK